MRPMRAAYTMMSWLQFCLWFLICTAPVLQPVQAQEVSEITVNERMVPCPEDPTVLGYQHLEDLMMDQERELERVATGERPRSPYNFALCPNWLFRNEPDLTLLLPDMNVTCGGGVISGTSAERCLLDGVKVIVPEDYTTTARLQGITFTSNSFIHARGQSASQLDVVDCIWTDLNIPEFPVILVHRESSDNNDYMTVQVFDSIVKDGTALSFLELPGGQAHVTNVTFTNFNAPHLATLHGASATAKMEEINIFQCQMNQLVAVTAGANLDVNFLSAFVLLQPTTLFHFAEGATGTLVNVRIEETNMDLQEAVPDVTIVHATTESQVRVEGIVVTNVGGILDVFRADTNAQMTVINQAVGGLTGRDTGGNVVSTIAMANTGGRMIVHQLSVSEISSFTAVYYSSCSSYLQVQQSCIEGAEIVTPGVVSVDSGFYSDGNHIAWDSVTGQMCSGGLSNLFNSNPDDPGSCFIGPVPVFCAGGACTCGGDCTDGLNESPDSCLINDDTVEFNIVQQIEIPLAGPSATCEMEDAISSDLPITTSPTASGSEETLSPTAEGLTAAPTSSSDSEASFSSVIDVLGSYEDATTFMDHLLRSDLATELQEGGNYTLFAANNQAWEAIARPELQTTFFKKHWLDLLSYQVASQVLPSSELRFGSSHPMLNGKYINITKDGRIEINNDSIVTTSDIAADNGVVHLISQVLHPPSYTMDALGAVIMDPRFSIAVELATRADMLETFSSTPLTFFAPTNAAFERFGGIEPFLELSEEDLAKVLQYHAFDNVLVSDFMGDGTSYSMLNGEEAVLSVGDEAVTIENATIVDLDVLVRNGVIHAIDSVLIPDSVDFDATNVVATSTLASSVTPSPTGTDINSQTFSPSLFEEAPFASVVDVVALNQDSSMILEQLQSTGLAEQLQEDGTFTLFVPSNSAWEALNYTFSDASREAHVQDLMKYHVATEILPASSLEQISFQQMLNGGFINVTGADPIQINYESIVTTADLIADNGVVHIVDSVLLPESYTKGLRVLIEDDARFSILAELLVNSSVYEDVQVAEDITLFAPTNAAFEKLGGVNAFLSAENAGSLTTILDYHVLIDFVTSDGLENGMNFLMANNEITQVSIDGTTTMINNATIIRANRLARNGILHAIDEVLIPESVSFVSNGTVQPDEIGTNCTMCSTGNAPLDRPSLDGDSSGCLDIEALYFAGQSPGECQYSRELLDESPVDIEAYCCQDIEEPMPCGTLCPPGTEVLDVDIPAEIDLSFISNEKIRCQQMATIVEYARNESTCVKAVESTREVCCGEDTVAAGIWDIVRDNMDLVLFRLAAERVNFDKVLKNFVPGVRNATLFAPTNDAMENDGIVSFVSSNENFHQWVGHITQILEKTVVSGEYLTTEMLWDSQDDDAIVTLSGETLTLDKGEQQIEGQNLYEPDLLARNGVVHTMNELFPMSWHDLSIAQVLESNGFDLVVEYLSATEEDVSSLTENGTTLVAFADDSGSNEAFISYHIIDSNIYQGALEDGTQRLVKTRDSISDLWLTVDDLGFMRYNGFNVQNEFFGNNGVIHELAKQLQPPVMVDFLDITSTNTDVKAFILHSFFVASGWDTTSLWSSLGEESSQRYTLIAPIDGNFDLALSDSDRERLQSPVWSRHLRDMLSNLLVASPYTKSDFNTLLGGASNYEMVMVGGDQYTLYGDNDDLSISDGRFLEISPSCTDGIIHFVDDITLPASVSQNIMERINANEEGSTFYAMLEDNEVRWKIENEAPLTVFVPLNGALSSEIQPSNAFLESHIFEDLWFIDDLAERDGGTITSIDGVDWRVSVNGGEVNLESEDRSVVIPLKREDEVLANNGVIHFVDGALHVGDATTSSENCLPCDSNLDTLKTFPDGLRCEEWAVGVSQLKAGSEQCLIERAAGVQYCGCFPLVAQDACGTCSSTATDDLVLPDSRGLTCGSLRTMVSIDGESTCNLLQEKYSAFCGCEDAIPPSCTFCNSYENKLFPSPDVKAITYNARAFGHLAGSNCEAFANFYAVQSESFCPDVDTYLMNETVFDMKAWCECDDSSPPVACGTSLCSDSAVLQESLVPKSELPYSCQQFSDAFPYIAVSDEIVCEEAKEIASMCCSLPTATVDTNFVLFNDDNLRSVDLVEQERARTLNEFYEEFVTSVVASVDTQSKIRMLRKIVGRQLTATYEPGTSKITAVKEVECPQDETIPDGVVCHILFGEFNLTVLGEDVGDVYTRYKAANDKAVENDDLQETMDSIDPDFPFTFTNVLVDADRSFQAKSGSDGLEWWAILLVVLGCILGVCGGYFIFAYFRDRKKDRQLEPLLDSENNEEASLMNASIKFDASGSNNPSTEDATTPFAELEEDGPADRAVIPGSNDKSMSNDSNHADVAWESDASDDNADGAKASSFKTDNSDDHSDVSWEDGEAEPDEGGLPTGLNDMPGENFEDEIVNNNNRGSRRKSGKDTTEKRKRLSSSVTRSKSIPVLVPMPSMTSGRNLGGAKVDDTAEEFQDSNQSPSSSDERATKSLETADYESCDEDMEAIEKMNTELKEFDRRVSNNLAEMERIGIEEAALEAKYAEDGGSKAGQRDAKKVSELVSIFDGAPKNDGEKENAAIGNVPRRSDPAEFYSIHNVVAQNQNVDE